MTLEELLPFTKNLKVLLAEDDELTAKYLKLSLERIFEEVIRVEDGIEALRLHASREYDILFTDIQMPFLDGDAMIKKIRQEDFETPIVIISGHDDSAKLVDLLNAGADGFLTKPLEKEQLFRVIYRVSRAVFDKKMVNEYHEKLEKMNHDLAQQNYELQKMHRVAKAQAVISAMNATKNSEESLPLSCSINDYYETLLADHIHELEELIDDLESYILLTFQNNLITEQYIIEIVERLQKFGNILYCYPLFETLSLSILDLARGIRECKEFVVAHQKLVLPFLENLTYLLEQYVADVWKKEAKNPLFYNATVSADISIFLGFLGAEEGSSEAENVIEFF